MNDSAVMPLYLNWSFWAVIVAAIAVVLSQLPPLHILFRRRRLLIEVHSRAHITHKVGNPNVGLFLGFTNVGGRSLRIKKLSLSIERDGRELVRLPAKAYFESLQNVTPMIFTPFTLKPEESWARRVNFYNEFSRNDEILFRKSSTALQGEISRLLSLQTENEKKVVHAEESFVVSFQELFAKLFIWEPGEYIAKVIIEVSPSLNQQSEILRFTIYESDSESLRQDIKDYPTGAGINFDTTKHTGLSVELLELNR